MLTISTRIRYGLLALAAVGASGERKPVRLNSIADRLGLSFKYLENIFRRLKQGGLVHGTRGPEGGYVLARPATDIFLDEVFTVLEGPLVGVECLEDDPACGRLELCPLKNVWKEFQDAMAGFLSRRTLADIIRNADLKRDAVRSACVRR
ncbi:MAG TPA: Rrf2 family transcriptional regulator [Spirochaetia bacterium]|nr:Rrf2 family transcriptional regulator [Spirochaetia bacterium]